MVVGRLPPGYFRFLAAALLTMGAGAQVVHIYYKPLEDMDKWIEKEKSLLGSKEKTKEEM